MARRTSHDRADDPGRELFLADAGQLTLGAFAGRDGDDLLEDLAADDGQRRALQNHPQLTSMSSSVWRYMREFVASLIDGTGLQPKTEPRLS